MALDRDTVLGLLKQIDDPISGSDIVAAGVMRALNVGDAGDVRFVLEIDPKRAKDYEAVQAAAETALKQAGAAKVSIVMTYSSKCNITFCPNCPAFSFFFRF